MRAALPCVLLLATACSAPSPRPASAAVVARAATLAPADARLEGLYAQSCKSCHARADSGAPLAGDSDAWRPRLARGMPALLTSAVNGINGMPAGGQCFACTPADYEALIRFMATEPAR